MVPVSETSGSQLLVEQEMINTETCETEDSKSSQKRKRGRPPKSLVKLPMAILQGSCHSSDVDNGDEPSDASNPAILNNREFTEYQQEWPFIKRSPMWATIESMELYQNPPQKPHFLLLKMVKEDYREGVAIGYMATFANMVQRTLKLQPDDPDVMIENSLETLVELETHGFDVGVVRGRLIELLSIKAKVGELKDRLKQAQREIEKQNLEKSKMNEEMDQLEAKMQELKEKMVENVKKKNGKDEEIRMLQSNLHVVGDEIMDWKADFERLAATPF